MDQIQTRVFIFNFQKYLSYVGGSIHHALNDYFGEMFVGGVGNLVFYCQDIWHFIYLFIYLILCLWLPQNVQSSLVLLCVFGPPKKIR